MKHEKLNADLLRLELQRGTFHGSRFFVLSAYSTQRKQIFTLLLLLCVCMCVCEYELFL